MRMKSVQVTGPGRTAIVDVDRPATGPADALLKIKACGICGSDHAYTAYGGVPPRVGATPLGHEPAAEVVEIGAQVRDLAVGDHVVPNPLAFADGLLGSGGAQGALSEYVLVEDVKPGVHLRVIPDHVPWHVAALNEPMAVARRAANRSGSKPGDKIVIFGAGPIGLGALLAFKARGAAHVVVVDLVPNRLQKAMQIGADAVINSNEQDVVARLHELHGDAPTAIGSRGVKPDTDVYLDAAGAPAVIDTVTNAAKTGATLTIVAVHKQPTAIDFAALLTSELTIVLSMGYADEIFEVTDDLIANWERYAHIVSDQVPHHDVLHALELAATPGAAEKVVVVFD